MRIQHNISALNAHRQLGSNNNAVAKNLEKLSSGYAINRAADNAAGLAISEKMRGQIRGLDQAQANAQDGISLIQTAEGALNETHDILQRMRELSVQSANGTYQNDVDRENIQKEVDALKGEIDRIASSTHYNKINLLDGSLASGGGNVAGAGGKNDSIKVVVPNAVAAAGSYGYIDATKGKYQTTTGITGGATWTGSQAGDTIEMSVRVDENGVENTYKFTLTVQADGKLKGADGSIYNGTTGAQASSEIGAAMKSEMMKSGLADNFDITGGATNDAFTFDAKEKGASAPKIVGVSTNTVTAGAPAVTKVVNTTAAVGSDGFETFDAAQATIFTGDNAADAVFEINGQKFAFAEDAANAKLLGEDVNVIITDAVDADQTVNMSNLINQKTGLSTQGGDVAGGVFTPSPDGAAAGTVIAMKAGNNTAATSNGGGLTFQIGANGSKDQRVSLSVDDMSTKGIGVSNISVSTQTAANKSIEIVDAAINTVSKQRAGLGALQNRLEHTVNNLGTTSENLTSSEARIRDVDMAKEMVNMSKNNILTQAAQAMLAQANTQPQGVLQLLK